MTILQSIELFTAINLLAVGLSHLLQPKIWVEFFMFLHSKKNVGNIFNAMLSIGMGSFIFSFHYVWTWPMLLVTMYGLGLTIKGFVYFIFPKIGINSIGKINEENGSKFKWAGIVMIIFSTIVFYELIMEGIFL